MNLWQSLFQNIGGEHKHSCLASVQKRVRGSLLRATALFGFLSYCITPLSMTLGVVALCGVAQANSAQALLAQKPLSITQGGFVAWYQQCFKKNYASCGLVGRAYYEGYGVLANMKQAQKFLTKACSNGVVESCLLLSDFTQDVSKREYLQLFHKQACELDNKESCKQLSDMLLEDIAKKATPALIGQVSALLKKICHLENDATCLRAHAFQAQIDGNSSVVEGVQFQKELAACQRAQEAFEDDKSACGLVGLRYAKGIGVERDKEKAHTYFHIACEDNNEFCRYEVLDLILN